MRAALTIGALIFGSGAAVAAPDLSVPMGQGSEIFWTSAYDGGSDKFYERLVVDQGDVQIFKTVNDYPAGDEGDYFVLFSGIYYTGCDSEMPTAEERTAVANLWPLTSGSTVEIKTGDGVKIEVGEQTEFFLMGRNRPAHKVTATYYGDEETSEELIILDDVKLTVGIAWQEGGIDSAMLVTKPDAVASTFANTDLIGTCGDLLNTETDQN